MRPGAPDYGTAEQAELPAPYSPAWLVAEPVPVVGTQVITLFGPEQHNEARMHAERIGGLLMRASVLADFR